METLCEYNRTNTAGGLKREEKLKKKKNAKSRPRKEQNSTKNINYSRAQNHPVHIEIKAVTKKPRY